MTITIYHNPDCGTSRNTLGLIRAAAGLSIREAVRQKGTPYLELGLDSPTFTDMELIEVMAANPILINRPFVVTPLVQGCAGRPSWCWISWRSRSVASSPRKTASV